VCSLSGGPLGTQEASYNVAVGFMSSKGRVESGGVRTLDKGRGDTDDADTSFADEV